MYIQLHDCINLFSFHFRWRILVLKSRCVCIFCKQKFLKCVHIYHGYVHIAFAFKVCSYLFVDKICVLLTLASTYNGTYVNGVFQYSNRIISYKEEVRENNICITKGDSLPHLFVICTQNKPEELSFIYEFYNRNMLETLKKALNVFSAALQLRFA